MMANEARSVFPRSASLLMLSFSFSGATQEHAMRLHEPIDEPSEGHIPRSNANIHFWWQRRRDVRGLAASQVKL